MMQGRLLKESAQTSCVCSRWNECTCLFKFFHLYMYIFFVSGDLKPGSDVKLTGPVGKEMLMPKDPNATVAEERQHVCLLILTFYSVIFFRSKFL